jgi:hypothetical protein
MLQNINNKQYKTSPDIIKQYYTNKQKTCEDMFNDYIEDLKANNFTTFANYLFMAKKTLIPIYFKDPRMTKRKMGMILGNLNQFAVPDVAL